MRSGTLKLSLLSLAMLAVGVDAAANGRHAVTTLAVYGDAPYGISPTDDSQTIATPAFIQSINDDPDVSLVLHVGDIHSGKQYCTKAYNKNIRSLWKAYADPLVYVPGDNEWADCHKAAEGGGTYNSVTGQIDYVLDAHDHPVDFAKGDPIANLALVREQFFSHPGRAIGGGKHVISQALTFDVSFPTDAKYVENVMWYQSGTLFFTFNMPGGANNGGDIWYGAPTMTDAQSQDNAERTGAALRWIDAAFAKAKALNAKAVVIQSQADMWDLDGKPASHLTGFEPVIAKIAATVADFGKPVLMFNGDSHIYRSDNPLKQGAPCVIEPTSGSPAVTCSDDDWNQHPSYNVSNFHRIVVHGSTFPLEWLKLTVDPSANAPATEGAFGPFSWQRMTQS